MARSSPHTIMSGRTPHSSEFSLLSSQFCKYFILNSVIHTPIASFFGNLRDIRDFTLIFSAIFALRAHSCLQYSWSSQIFGPENLRSSDSRSLISARPSFCCPTNSCSQDSRSREFSFLEFSFPPILSPRICVPPK